MPHCFMPFISAKKGARKNPFCAALLAATTLMGASLFEPEQVSGAISSKIADQDFIPSTDTGNKLDPASLVSSKLSGSPYPGIVDCLLQRRANDNISGIPASSVHINYPSIGDARIDADIREWVSDMADAFENHMDFTQIELDDAISQADASLEALKSGRLIDPDYKPAYELWGEYQITRPSNAAVSIAFELWNYTGSAEGNLDIITLNYSRLTGQRLNFVDIFEKPDIALKLMSSWSRKELEQRLGSARRARMLETGTEPLVENFSSFTLTPEGICIKFQPWQVAPNEAGIQTVKMPLEELMPSLPMLDLWGRG